MDDDGTARPDRPWKVDETTNQPRGGGLMIVFGLLLCLWGGVNVMEYGSGISYLVTLLGIGLLLSGITVRSVRGSAIRQRH
ncbi:hypothetical protein [Jannaschia sp. R86511]|uniref:hypothetical protein n=1 Tax=Jannaschia sp. R86511 TaxID=3093853 RepID=UPI0036D25CA6